MKELFHVDPITIILLLTGFIATWTTLKKDSGWHTSWIKKHDQECDEQREANTKLFTALQTTNAHLATLTEGHEKRLDRVEKYVDQVRI